jgi:hypothetical protein
MKREREKIEREIKEETKTEIVRG